MGYIFHDLVGKQSSSASLLLMLSTNTRVGFKFHPSDEEIIYHFLTNIVVLGRDSLVQQDVVVLEDDICKLEPSDLRSLCAKQLSNNGIWHYLLYERSYKYKNSKRVNRTTRAGYWKPTGKSRQIRANGSKNVIGIKRTLVYYLGSVGKRNGEKTNWVIHEYELPATLPNPKYNFVFCKLKMKGDDRAKASSSSCSEEFLEGQSSDYCSSSSSYENQQVAAADDVIFDKDGLEQPMVDLQNGPRFHELYNDFLSVLRQPQQQQHQMVENDQVASSFTNSPNSNGFSSTDHVTEHYDPYNDIYQQNDEFWWTSNFLGHYDNAANWP